jgi:hypothetical protein
VIESPKFVTDSKPDGSLGAVLVEVDVLEVEVAVEEDADDPAPAFVATGAVENSLFCPHPVIAHTAHTTIK